MGEASVIDKGASYCFLAKRKKACPVSGGSHVFDKKPMTRGLAASHIGLSSSAPPAIVHSSELGAWRDEAPDKGYIVADCKKALLQP